MIAFVVVRDKDHKYVAVSGSKSSYTARVKDARLYLTREAAQADACGNETVREVFKCLSGYSR